MDSKKGSPAPKQRPAVDGNSHSGVDRVRIEKAVREILLSIGEDPDRVKRLAEMGVTRVVPMFPPERADTVLPIVDRWTKIMQQVNG